ncbi:MAG: shikimate kinase [Alteromonadaceae bacterium]|nr:MAG: shikimate kinase [Alteromonadaceae bacterium]
MPGAGKTTLGVGLADSLDLEFIDTDQLIEAKIDDSLQSYLDAHGYLALRTLEQSVLLSSDFNKQVIATGGSVVYGEQAMALLASKGPVVFIDVSEAVLLKRVHNIDTRGIAKAPMQTFHQLFEERRALYRHYADITVMTDGTTAVQALKALRGALI